MEVEDEKLKEKSAYEERLRRRLKILREKFDEGKIALQNDAKIKESLLAVRYGPNGEIDLATVNGIVRSLALAVTAIHDGEELKKAISLLS